MLEKPIMLSVAKKMISGDSDACSDFIGKKGL